MNQVVGGTNPASHVRKKFAVQEIGQAEDQVLLNAEHVLQNLIEIAILFLVLVPTATESNTLQKKLC